MSHQSRKIMGQAIKDPQKLYNSPEEVVSDPRLTREEKDRILQSWEQDQIALMRAEEENMTQNDGTPSPVDLLEKVKKAEKKLEEAKEENG